ncbi:transcription termination/antitermination protein NusG, partial [Verrucomicrobiales bacterium]|nr:transcription termination/antitermination protein NusG [Verrucomicrobiales bacterium]
MAVPAPNDQWFAVHVLSGQENKVRENIKRRMISEEMGELVFQVLVPTERVSEVRGGKKMETNRKIYPGYVIVNMHLLEEDGGMVDRTWYFIQETPGVIKFAGTKDKPMSMRKREVDSMLSQITE